MREARSPKTGNFQSWIERTDPRSIEELETALMEADKDMQRATDYSAWDKVREARQRRDEVLELLDAAWTKQREERERRIAVLTASKEETT